jgi:hypothetical protein
VNSGDLAALSAVVAACAAIGALFITGIAAKAARDQTKIQQKLREDARTEEEHGVVMVLVVGNSGPTARVKATSDPSTWWILSM